MLRKTNYYFCIYVTMLRKSKRKYVKIDSVELTRQFEFFALQLFLVISDILVIRVP